MELKENALIIRKHEGGLLIFGRSLSGLEELIKDDDEYLVLGDITLNPSHIFKGLKERHHCTPDLILMCGGLDHENYKEKIK